MVRVALAVIYAAMLLAAPFAHAAVIELEGTVKAIDADARTISIERKTAKGTKTLDLEVNKKAGDLSAVKIGDKISFSYDPDLEVVTKMGGASPQPATFDKALFFRDLESLQGEWTTTHSIIGGKPVDPDTLGKQKHRIEVMGTEMVIHAALPSREVYNVRYFTLDAAKKHITLWWRDSDGKLNQGVGIYSLTGDELKICYAYNPDGNTSRPTEFASVPGPPPNASHTYTRAR